jgi:two-component system sensor histidine kinase HydH
LIAGLAALALAGLVTFQKQSAHAAAARAVSKQGTLLATYLAGQQAVRVTASSGTEWGSFADLARSLHVVEPGLEYVSVVSDGVTLFHKQAGSLGETGSPVDVASLTNALRTLRVRRRLIHGAEGATPVVAFSVRVTGDDGTVRVVEVGLRREAVLREERLAVSALSSMFAVSLLTIAAAFTVCVALVVWMMHREDLRQRLRRMEEHLAFSGALANGIVHDFRNPMSSVRLDAQMLLKELEKRGETRADRAQELAARIRSTVDRMDRIFQEFLYLARPSPETSSPLDLAALARECVAILAPRFEAARVTVSVTAPDGPVRAMASEAALRRALINVLTNAEQFSPPNGSVAVRVASVEGGVAVDIEDQGPGIKAEDRKRLFQMFHSTRPGGTGLGLFLARAAVEKSGGTIECLDRPGPGACFRIRLPRAAPEAAACPRSADGPGANSGSSHEKSAHPDRGG